MDERRNYPREELYAAMICSLKSGNISTYCVVKNLSLDGAQLDCPLAGRSKLFDTGDEIVLTDVLEGMDVLMDGVVGEVVWVYKRTLGIHFRELLKPTSEALRDWLEERHLA